MANAASVLFCSSSLLKLFREGPGKKQSANLTVFGSS
jgi:hypothetical protein